MVGDTNKGGAERRAVLLQLYSIERAEQQSGLQQALASVGAGLAYGVPVGALLSARCDTAAGCDGVGDAVLYVAPLPAVGILGFVLINQTLIERRARYLEALEAELALTTPREAGDLAFPFFARRVLTQVYGRGLPWYLTVAAMIWAVAAFIIAAGLTTSAMLFLPGSVAAWIARVVYVVVLLALAAASLETIWINRGATEGSMLHKVIKVVGGMGRAGHVTVDSSPAGDSTLEATDSSRVSR